METGRTLALAPEREMGPMAAAKGATFPEGYDAEGPTVTVTPAEEATEGRPGTQGPFAPEEQVVKTETGKRFMAEIGAPVPVRGQRRKPELVAALPPAAATAGERGALSAAPTPKAHAANPYPFSTGPASTSKSQS